MPTSDPSGTIRFRAVTMGSFGRGCSNERERRRLSQRENVLSLEAKKQSDVFMEMAFSLGQLSTTPVRILPRSGLASFVSRASISSHRTVSSLVRLLLHPHHLSLTHRHPLPHDTNRGHSKTLHRPEKGHRHRTRCRHHLLRRILRAFGPRANPEDIRGHQVSGARSPPHFPFTVADLPVPIVPFFTPFVRFTAWLKHVD